MSRKGLPWSTPLSLQSPRPSSRHGVIAIPNAKSTGFDTGRETSSSDSSIASSSSAVSQPDTTNLPADSTPFCISLVPISGYCEYALASEHPQAVVRVKHLATCCPFHVCLTLILQKSKVICSKSRAYEVFNPVVGKRASTRVSGGCNEAPTELIKSPRCRGLPGCCNGFLLSLQKFKDVLRNLVSLSQHCGARLLEDLRAREICSFGGEICITNPAA